MTNNRLGTYDLRTKILGFLETIKDEGSFIDTGHCFIDDSSECFVTVGGVEYNVIVKKCAVAANEDDDFVIVARSA